MIPSQQRRRRAPKRLTQKLLESFKTGSNRYWYMFVLLSSCLAAGLLIYVYESNMPTLKVI